MSIGLASCGLEQFDQVAGGILGEDLRTSGPLHHRVPEPDACPLESLDVSGQVVGDEVDAVPSSGPGFLAALAAGLPQVCLPQAADQFLNAAACGRSGTGITVAPGDQTAEQVTAALGGVLSDASFRTAAGRVSAEIAAMPSAHEVAELLERRFS